MEAVVFLTEVLRNFHVPWIHIAMEKQTPVSELDHYVMTKMYHAVAEGLEVQCYQEYCSETEEYYRATAILG